MLSEFATLLVAGISLILVFLPSQGVRGIFYRTQCWVLLGFLVTAALTFQSEKHPPHAWPALIVGAVVAYMGSIFWTLERRYAGWICLSLISGLSVVSLIQPNSPDVVWRTAHHLSAAISLGSLVEGMLLGHSYLTAPGMPLRPFWQLGYLVVISSVLRAALCLAALLSSEALSDYWDLLTLRWLAGIVCPIILGLMVLRILRYRNTQSATGVLFAGVILGFLGELAATLIRHQVGYPI